MKELLRAWWLEERKKFRRMSGRERLQYIRQYYSLWIIGVISVIALIVFVIVHLVQGPPEYWLAAAFANTRTNAETGSQLWKDFTAYSGYDLDEKKVEFNSNLYFDYADNGGKGSTYYNGFVVMADTGTLDLITMRPEQLSALGRSGRLMDWNDEQCDRLRSKYADRLIWYEPAEGDDSAGPIPVGIDISDSLLVGKYFLYSEENGCALGIGGKSSRLDAVEVFLKFILEEE